MPARKRRPRLSKEEANEKVLTLAKKKGEVTIKDVAKALNRADQRASQIIRALVKAGKMQEIGKQEGGRGKPATLYGVGGKRRKAASNPSADHAVEALNALLGPESKFGQFVDAVMAGGITITVSLDQPEAEPKKPKRTRRKKAAAKKKSPAKRKSKAPTKKKSATKKKASTRKKAAPKKKSPAKRKPGSTAQKEAAKKTKAATKKKSASKSKKKAASRKKSSAKSKPRPKKPTPKAKPPIDESRGIKAADKPKVDLKKENAGSPAVEDTAATKSSEG